MINLAKIPVNPYIIEITNRLIKQVPNVSSSAIGKKSLIV